METVYIEKTIVSYLVANLHRDAILAAHQQLTRQRWQDQRPAYHCLVSGEKERQRAGQPTVALNEEPPTPE